MSFKDDNARSDVLVLRFEDFCAGRCLLLLRLRLRSCYFAASDLFGYVTPCSPTIFGDRQKWRVCLAPGKFGKFVYDISHSIRVVHLISISARVSCSLQPEPSRRTTPRASKQSDDDDPVFAGYTPSPFRRIRLCASDETGR